MMDFLSIESSLGLAVSLEDQHHHCGPEKCCPEACPQRLLNERTEKRRIEEESKHLKACYFQSIAEMPAVNMLTQPRALCRQCRDPALPPRQLATSFIQHVSPLAEVRMT